jgi:hypothetical protein
MAATVRGAIRELLEQTMTTVDALLEASDRELPLPSSHACARGKDTWTLVTNDIDHEKIHAGQVLEGRYESRLTPSPIERLAAEWLVERARFVASLIGLTDEQFNRETAPGQWTYRVVAKHVLKLEQDSLRTIAADQGVRRSQAGSDHDPRPGERPALACALDAIPAAQREAHVALATDLFRRPEPPRRELPDGYEFHFPASRIEALARFVENERRCCPFVRFELVVDGSGVALRMSGPPGTRELLQAELSLDAGSPPG